MLPSWFASLSYGGLFVVIVATGVGLPVPEDVVVLGAGYLVYRGATALAPTAAIALVGVLVGDLALYGIGRQLGARVIAHPRVARRFPAERRARAERWFARFGVGALVLARFVAGMRALIYVTAGTLRVPLARFVAVDAIASLVQVPLLVWIGAQAGPGIERVAAVIARSRLAVTVALVLLVMLMMVMMVLRRATRARR